MGQKVHPYGFRLGYNKNWQSRWFSKKEYASFVFEDHKIRTFVKKLLYSAGISRIEIERFGGKIRLILSTARPGIVIGRKGAEIEKLRGDLKKKFGREFALEVNEIRRPEIESQLVAENIAMQLERRVAFRRGQTADGDLRLHVVELLPGTGRRAYERPRLPVPRDAGVGLAADPRDGPGDRPGRRHRRRHGHLS